MSKTSDTSLLRRREVLAGAAAFGLASTTGAIARSSNLPPKSKMMNAVALGFIDEDGRADAIPALQAFIRACVEKGQNVGYLPGVARNKQGYRFRPIASWYKHPERGLRIPPNFTLVGDDPATTKFFLDPSVFDRKPATWPAYGFIFYSSGSSLQNLGFDGQRQLVKGGAETTFQACFIKAAEDACKGALFKNIYMTGNIGGLQESFCLSTGYQEDGTIFQNVRCVDNNGSGLSLNGDMVKEVQEPGTGLNRNIRVIDCEGSGNTWQGITAYGCQDTLIRNFTAIGNGATKRWAGNGANFEWTYRMHVSGGRFERNVGGGIGGYGDNDALLIDGGFVTSGNNTMRSWKSAEIAFAKGAWWSLHAGKLSGLMRRMVIRHGSISPLVDAHGQPIYHLHIDRKETPAVSYPSAGAPEVPRVTAMEIARLGSRPDWNLTPFTDPSGLQVM